MEFVIKISFCPRRKIVRQSVVCIKFARAPFACRPNNFYSRRVPMTQLCEKLFDYVVRSAGNGPKALRTEPVCVSHVRRICIKNAKFQVFRLQIHRRRPSHACQDDSSTFIIRSGAGLGLRGTCGADTLPAYLCHAVCFLSYSHLTMCHLYHVSI